MNKVSMRPTVAAAAVAGALMALGGQAHAAGFQLMEQSASGLGVAYAGMAAAVQDASTAFWNPAGMGYLQGKGNLAGAIHYIIPSTKYSDNGTSTYAQPPFSYGNGGQGGESAWVPALFGTYNINQQWSVGLAVNAPFGLGTEWDTPWVGQFHGVKSEIKTMNLNPSVAFKANNMFSVGLGVSYQRLEATLTNAVSPLIPGSQGQVKGSDWAWGWNAGLMFDFQQGTRLGLTYRSSVSYTLNGDLTFNVPLPGSNVSADVKLPDVWSIALSHQVDPKLRLLADYTYTGWNSIQNLNIVRTSGPASGTTASSTPLNFNNSWRIGVGAEYQLNQPWLLRAGLAYDTTPVQDEFRTPRLPDENRTWLSVGARYSASQALSFDLGYTYIWVDNAASQLPNSPPGAGTLNGTYKANINILAAQVNYRF